MNKNWVCPTLNQQFKTCSQHSAAFFTINQAISASSMILILFKTTFSFYLVFILLGDIVFAFPLPVGPIILFCICQEEKCSCDVEIDGQYVYWVVIFLQPSRHCIYEQITLRSCCSSCQVKAQYDQLISKKWGSFINNFRSQISTNWVKLTSG